MEDLAVVALGCLLHDIGKIVQRADETPLRQGHSRFGADLMQSAGLLKESKYWYHVFESIRYHHRRFIKDGAHSLATAHISCEANAIVSRSITDKLLDSEGYPREEADSGPESWNRQKRLESIYALLQTASGRDPVSAYYPMSQTEGRSITPLRCPYPDESATEERAAEFYLHIRDLVVSRLLAYLQGRDPRSMDLVNEVSRYLEAHLSYIPAECLTDSACYMSLYDQASLVSAVGSVLEIWSKEYAPVNAQDTKEWNAAQHLYESKPCLILTACLCGADEFLLLNCPAHRNVGDEQETSEKQKFKSRARYVELLRQWFVEQFLRIDGLSKNNILLNSGSSFTLLLPNTPRTLASCARMHARANEWLLKQFGGMLQLSLDCTEVSATELTATSLQRNEKSLMGRIMTNLQQQRREPFKGMLSDLFTAQQRTQCAECGNDRFSLSSETEGGKICAACAAANASDQTEDDGDALFTASYLIEGKTTTGGALPIWNDQSAKFENGEISLSRDHDRLSAVAARTKPLPAANTNPTTMTAVMYARIGLPPGAADISTQLKNSFINELLIHRNLERFLDRYVDDFKAEKDPAQFARCERVFSSPDELILTGPPDRLIDFAIQIHQRLHKYTSGTMTLSCGLAVSRRKIGKHDISALARRAAELQRQTHSSMCVDFDVDRVANNVVSINWHDWRREVRPLMHDLHRLRSRAAEKHSFWNELLTFACGTGGSFYKLLFNLAKFDQHSPALKNDALWQRFKRQRILPLGSRSSDVKQRLILAAAMLWIELSDKSSVEQTAERYGEGPQNEPAKPTEPEGEPYRQDRQDTLTVGGAPNG